MRRKKKLGERHGGLGSAQQLQAATEAFGHEALLAFSHRSEKSFCIIRVSYQLRDCREAEFADIDCLRDRMLVPVPCLGRTASVSGRGFPTENRHAKNARSSVAIA